MSEGVASVPRQVRVLEHGLTAAAALLRALEKLPASHRDHTPAAERLAKAVGALYDAYDARREPLQALGDARQLLSETTRSLADQRDDLGESLADLERALEELPVAEEVFGRHAPQPVADEPLRASQNLPRLHHVPRPSLAPHWTLAPTLPPEPKAPRPLPPPATIEAMDAHFAELQARADARRKAAKEKRDRRAAERVEAKRMVEHKEVPEGYTPGPHNALDADGFIKLRVRECFEEVAMLGMQRAPLLGDPWRSASVLEKRLLTCLDALAALGPRALRQVEPLVMDAPAIDPSRLFATAMIMGCVRGRDGLGVAERVAAKMGLETEDTRTALTDALKLVPHPEVATMCRMWLEHASPSWRAAGIDVLAYRGWATPEELAVACGDDAMVRQIALPWAARARIEGVIEWAREAALSDDAGLRHAAWDALLLMRAPHALNGARDQLNADTGPAALRLALAGTRNDAEQLTEMIADAASKREIAFALGWAGHVGAIAPLIALLEHDDFDLALTAAFALIRITGAEMFDDVDVPPEKIDVADVAEPDEVGIEETSQKLGVMVSDPRDKPSDGSPDRMRLPTISPTRWKSYWRNAAQNFSISTRYRRGRPHSPLVSLLELDDYLLPPGERRILQLELMIRTGKEVRLDPHDFVPVQEAALEEWVEPARGASGSPGTW